MRLAGTSWQQREDVPELQWVLEIQIADRKLRVRELECRASPEPTRSLNDAAPPRSGVIRAGAASFENSDDLPRQCSWVRTARACLFTRLSSASPIGRLSQPRPVPCDVRSRRQERSVRAGHLCDPSVLNFWRRSSTCLLMKSPQRSTKFFRDVSSRKLAMQKATAVRLLVTRI